MSSVAVILVGHDSRPFLERALASVDGSGDDVEIALVDNASTDDTVDVVRRRFPRCRVIEAGENLGFGRACNLGVRETTSELILLLNPDTWVDPTCVDRLRQAMAADPRLAWAAPRLCYPDRRRQFVWEPTVSVLGETIRRLRNRFEQRRWAHGALPRALRALGDPGWYSAACALVRRSAWEEAGGFDPGFFLYFEDADLGLRLRRAGWRLAEIDGALAHHDRQPPSVMSESRTHYRESQLRYYRKHRPRWENRVLLRKLVRGAREITDEAARARMLAVCERAQKAFEAGVVDLPEVEVTVREARATSPPTASPTPASRS